MTSRGPRRGEVWIVSFNPGRGAEQHGRRPALVVQNDVGNTYAGTSIVAAITTTRRPYPVTVLLDENEGGLARPSMVNLAQLLTVDQGRLERRLGQLQPHRLRQVDVALQISLGLEAP